MCDRVIVYIKVKKFRFNSGGKAKILAEHGQNL